MDKLEIIILVVVPLAIMSLHKTKEELKLTCISSNNNNNNSSKRESNHSPEVKMRMSRIHSKHPD